MFTLSYFAKIYVVFIDFRDTLIWDIYYDDMQIIESAINEIKHGRKQIHKSIIKNSNKYF